MNALDYLATLAGLALVAAALREVFHTLLHPSGVGQLTPAIFRGVWRLGRRGPGQALGLAGPLAIVLSLAAWTLMLILGWALVYWPHLPDQFQIAQGIPPAAQGDILDAVYVSAVTLSTLGFGDIVAEATPLRLALVTEALVGFALLSAAISWVLSIYPALMRRRSLASRVSNLVTGAEHDPRLAEGDPGGTLALVLHAIAEQVGTARVDLVQYPATYFFDGPSEDLALSVALPRLKRALERDDVPAEARRAAEVLRSAIDAFGETLRQGPFGLRADSPGEALSAYATDHRP